MIVSLSLSPPPPLPHHSGPTPPTAYLKGMTKFVLGTIHSMLCINELLTIPQPYIAITSAFRFI